jgi:hypothetical protein
MPKTAQGKDDEDVEELATLAPPPAPQRDIDVAGKPAVRADMPAAEELGAALEPNDVLNEKELVEEMGMSRTPISRAEPAAISEQPAKSQYIWTQNSAPAQQIARELACCTAEKRR